MKQTNKQSKGIDAFNDFFLKLEQKHVIVVSLGSARILEFKKSIMVGTQNSIVSFTFHHFSITCKATSNDNRNLIRY